MNLNELMDPIGCNELDQPFGSESEGKIKGERKSKRE